MAYGQGELIRASDYNQIREDVGEVYNDRNGGVGFPFVPNSSDYGYGVSQISSPVNATDTITAQQWTQLFTEIHNCATHQATSTGGVPDSVVQGDLIEAYDGIQGLNALVNNIRNNRLTFDPANFDITSGGAMLNSQRTSSWSSQIQHVFRVTFPTLNDMRYFFNSGGQIRMTASRTGGTANTQNSEWSAALSSLGSVNFGYDSTSITGLSTNTPIGFYNLTTTNQLLYSLTVRGGGAYYGEDRLEIYARFNTGFPGSGTQLIFTMRFIPDLTSGEGNSVSGTLNSNVDKREAIIYVPPPNTLTDSNFTTITALSSN